MGIMDTRVCRRCSINQSMVAFRPYGTIKGHRWVCLSCERAAANEWRKRNLENGRAAAKRYASKNAAKVKRRKAENRKKKSAQYAAYARAYYAKNRGALINYYRLRAAALKLAAPAWLTVIHRAQIQEMYDIAEARTVQTGTPHEVDHIVPLKHPRVCGLHVPWNLQVLTQSANRQKRNNLIEGVT